MAQESEIPELSKQMGDIWNRSAPIVWLKAHFPSFTVGINGKFYYCLVWESFTNTPMQPNQESKIEGVDEFRERLEELSPSCKLVAFVLLDESHLTPNVIAEKTLLPKRTVRYALNRLMEAELVDSRIHFADPRTNIYFIDH